MIGLIGKELTCTSHECGINSRCTVMTSLIRHQ